MKIKDIMNKDIQLLEPFKYNPKSWHIDASNYLAKRKNTYRKSPVIKPNGELIGLVDVFQMKADIENNLSPKFIKIPFLYAEDDLNLYKNRKIDDKYFDENCHIFVVDEKGILVGFMLAEVVRLMVNVKYLYTFIKAINNVHDGVVLADKNSKIMYVNDAYSKILGVDKYKIINRFIRKIEPDALILEVLEKQQPIVNALVKVKSVGKDIVVNISPIMVQDELVGALSIFKDVTAVRTLTKELENMKRLTGYFYNGAVNSQVTLPLSFTNIVGKDEKFLRCLKLAAIVAPTDAAVLIEGESGVGKEVIVEAIVKESKRGKKPFIRINCSAIPENLFESELFGYEEGSFTGAQRGGKEGKFELADGGTIFLDEIGEMPLFMQAKLLRVLQSGEIQTIGSNAVQRVDVRIIAATNRDLKSMVKEGKFREDLYFRLNTFTITIPPLRERKGDIILLIEHFRKIYCDKYSKKVEFSADVLDCLIKYSWPGNVREIQSCVEYAVILCQGDMIGFEHLPEEIQKAGSDIKGYNILGKQQELRNMIFEVEKNKIIESLKETGGNRTKAIEKLGMSRRTFYRKLKAYNINPDLYTK